MVYAVISPYFTISPCKTSMGGLSVLYGYWQLDIGYGRLEKRKKSAKLLQDTAKSCQYLRKFLKKCIFMAFLRNEGFFVFLYEKVVVILQWISRETMVRT